MTIVTHEQVNNLGRMIYDFAVAEGEKQNLHPGAIILAMLVAMENIAINTDLEELAMSSMGDTSSNLLALRSAKVETRFMTCH